jgi:hypothetical protein
MQLKLIDDSEEYIVSIFRAEEKVEMENSISTYFVL